MIKLIVDCEHNDDEFDLKCGGASILGYDFYIDDDSNVEEYKSFIKDELKKHNQPLINITDLHIGMKSKPWTKEMISKCIEKGY